MTIFKHSNLWKLVKSIKRAWKEDKYKYLRRNFQAGNNLLLTGEQSIRREIDVLKSCRHPNIVQLLEVIDIPDHPKVHLVMEYMAGGEIQWRNDHDEPILTVSQSRRIFRDVSLGLEYLHHLGIVHCDIKPANIPKLLTWVYPTGS
jgi:serine/threonine protein kinase